MQWLERFFGWLAEWIPQVRHLECTDIGVSIHRGDRIKSLPPGLHVYWPIWTSIYTRPGNLQTVNLPTQALTTHDNQIVVVGGMVRYEFERSDAAVVRALVDTDDVESAIIDESLAAFCDLITTRSMRELQEERSRLNRSLTGKLSTRLGRYGVVVLRAQLTDFSPCVTLNHVRNNPAPSEES